MKYSMKNLFVFVIILVTHNVVFSGEHEHNIWIKKNNIQRFESEQSIVFKATEERGDIDYSVRVLLTKGTSYYCGLRIYFIKQNDGSLRVKTALIKDPETMFKELEKKFNG